MRRLPGDVVVRALDATTDEPAEIIREAAVAVLSALLDEGYHLLGTPTWTDIEESNFVSMCKTLRLEGSFDALAVTSQKSISQRETQAVSWPLITAVKQAVIHNYLAEVGKLLGLTPLDNDTKESHE